MPRAATAGPRLDDYVAGVRSGDRAMLARAITLVESTKPEHAAHAQALLQALLPATGRALRLGVTGVPGVGKSTTIDQLGMNLIAPGHRLAVLAVDPTSKRTGGSILGDKTRMSQLAQEPNAFIRPSPTSGTLGGVTRKTRETMALAEAAGFDVVIVETVGVGQSEIAVADMVDFFLVLLLSGGGDDLQGIKKGIIEIADMIAINKADGDNVTRAERAAARVSRRAADPDAAVGHLGAPGRHHFRPREPGARRLVGQDPRAPRQDQGIGRVRHAPPAPGGGMDARHAERPRDGRTEGNAQSGRAAARLGGRGPRRKTVAHTRRRRANKLGRHGLQLSNNDKLSIVPA